MICGLVLKYLNMSGLVMIGRYETTLPYTSQFTLTLPYPPYSHFDRSIRGHPARGMQADFNCLFVIGVVDMIGPLDRLRILDSKPLNRAQHREVWGSSVAFAARCMNGGFDVCAEFHARL